MVVVKCNKCGEQITAVNFQKGDTIKCPNCENNQIMRSIAWDTKIGASRSSFRGLMWTIGLLIYTTMIIYVVLETSFKIYNKDITYCIALFWVICPICAYFSIKEKQEKREKCQEDMEKEKDFDREMLGHSKRYNPDQKTCGERQSNLRNSESSAVAKKEPKDIGENWAKIKRGMSKEQVVELLGEPTTLFSFPNGEDWRYGTSQWGGIIFFLHDKVDSFKKAGIDANMMEWQMDLQRRYYRMPPDGVDPPQ